MSTSMIMVVLALSASCGAYYFLTAQRGVATPLPHPVVVSAYTSCDALGCCDEVPGFCKRAVPAFAEACSYQSIASRCAHSCGQCHARMEAVPECQDEMPTCARLAQATGPAFCELDLYRTKCRLTCGTCGVTCEDSRSHRVLCANAQKDLRKCAAARTSEQCPETCGVCSGTPLATLLARQPCVDAPECALDEREVSDAAVNRYRACEDFDGSCGFTPARPDHQTLCSDPTYRDVLCRATCQSCPHGPAPPLPKPEAPPQKLLWRPKSTCSAVEARTCPRKCGVCKPRGARSDWDVQSAERLVATPMHLREQ